MATFGDEIIESASLGDEPPPGINEAALRTGEALGDTVKIYATSAWANLFVDTATESLALTSEATVLAGVLVVERLNLVELYVPRGVYGAIYAESLQLLDAAGIARQATVLESLEVADTPHIARSVQVIEALGLGETLRGAASYGMQWVDSVLLADALTRFVAGTITETLELTPVWGAQQRAQRQIADSIELSEVFTPRFLLSVVVEDGVEITAEELVQAIYQPTLRENLEIGAAYLSPGGGFTAWTMNTRTAAVTEYDNFEFNSFASVGNKYIGASESGLYELNGDTDDGDDVVARIKSGFMQFGGTHLSRLKAAYLGVRGDGDFVLKIVTGDGAAYNYAASTRDMRSTKVHMGKGQRARYFAFELISAGQDFDLDTIEFVPIVVQRRV